jgi:hypothetical protein
VHPEEDRPHVVGNPERQALGEIEDGDPEKDFLLGHQAILQRQHIVARYEF